MEYSISKNIIFSEFNKSYSLELNSFTKLRKTDWSYGKLEYDTYNIVDLFRLNNIEVSFEIPQKFKTSIEQLNLRNTNIIWEYILPDKVYQKLVSELADNISKHFKVLETEYYKSTFKLTNDFLKDLCPAKVNRKKLLKYIRQEDNKTSISNLETFVVDDAGYCSKVFWNRFASRTGRLVVKQGPRILVLKKDYKDMFESRYENGKILQFDYVSFEARLALSLADKHCESEDVYQFINEEIFDSKFNRNSVKEIVLSTLYGMSINKLSSKLYIEHEKVKEYVDKIKKYFRFEQTHEKLLESIKKTNSIKSYFGRNIKIENHTPGAVYNSYVQSTGVDAALLGFNSINQFAKKHSLNFSPLYVLHDALIVDVSPELLKHIDKLKSLGENIPGITNKFYLSTTSLCTSA